MRHIKTPASLNVSTYDLKKIINQCSPTDETMSRLPGIDPMEDQNLILDPLWQLAPIFFFFMFPPAVFEYILEQVMSKTVLLARPGS